MRTEAIPYVHNVQRVTAEQLFKAALAALSKRLVAARAKLVPFMRPRHNVLSELVETIGLLNQKKVHALKNAGQRE